MTDKEIGVSPEEWAKALKDARDMETWHTRQGSIPRVARVLLAAQAEIERLRDERDVAKDQLDYHVKGAIRLLHRHESLRTLAEGMAGRWKTFATT